MAVLLKESTVQNTLIELGIPVNLLGFRYLTKAIQVYTPGMKITRDIYVAIGNEFDVPPSRVERAIRHSIESSSADGISNVMYEFFGNTIGRDRCGVTNSRFIATVSLRIKQRCTC